MSQKKNKPISSRKDKKRIKPFRFGVPLDQLPCTYLPDFGNVAAFLVEAGEFIRCHVDVEGLFRKSADLSRHNELKLQAERGDGLRNLDVHEVTCLVKTFLRLLPEPLLPCLFHDPFLSSMELPDHQRTEAVQDLCFALPAPHLSCLRYFMNLLAYITSHADHNRMNARNLAVVLTPSLIRLKARTKLMSLEELRVLPKQTALVEHLIYHADGIGCMTSQLYHHTIKMSEELLRKKLDPKKKKKGKLWINLEERLGVARAALGIMATLHFRPNTSTSVSDTILVDGPHGLVVSAPSPARSTCLNSELDVSSHLDVKIERDNSRALQKTIPTKTSYERSRSRKRSCERSRKRKQKHDRYHRAAKEKSTCKAMLVPLVQAWSNAIPVISSSSDDSHQGSCSPGDTSWSHEDYYDSYIDEEEKKTQPEIVAKNVGQFLVDSSLLVKNLDNPNEIAINLINESSPTVMTRDKQITVDQSISNIQIRLKEEWKRGCKNSECSHELAHASRRCISFDSIHSPGHIPLHECKTSDCLSKDGNWNTENQKDECGTSVSSEASTNLLREEYLEANKTDKISSDLNQCTFHDQQYSKKHMGQFAGDTNQEVKVHDICESEVHQQWRDLRDEKGFEKCSDSQPRVQDEQISSPPNASTEDARRRAHEVNSTCCSLTESIYETFIKAVPEDQLLHSYEKCEKDQPGSGMLNQHSQDVDAQEPFFASTLLSTSPQQCESEDSHTQELPTILPTKKAGKLKRRLLQSAQRHEVLQEQQKVESTRDSIFSKQNWTECQMCAFGSILSDVEDSTAVLTNCRETALLESKKSASVLHENDESKAGLTLNSSSNKQCKFNCGIDTPKCSHFQQLQQDSHCLELYQQQIFSFGMENIPPHLFDCIKHERPVVTENRQKELTVKMQRIPFSQLTAAQKIVTNCEQNQHHQLSSDTENLPFYHHFNNEHKREILQWHSYRTERPHNNSLHLQNDSAEECNCCVKHSPGLEHPTSQNLSLRLSESSNQQGKISHHCHSDSCSGINLSTVLPLTERQPQYMENYLQLGNETISNCNSFCRFSYGFQSLKPQYYEGNLVSEYAFDHEGNGYTANLTNPEQGYYRHFSKIVPTEVLQKNNETDFLASSYSDKLVHPSLCSHSMVQKNSYKTLLAQEKHVQNENIPCGKSYCCGWTIWKDRDIFQSLDENKSFRYKEMHHPNKLPGQAMVSNTWTKEQSRNEWEWQTKDHVERQNISQQEKNACLNMYPKKEWTSNEFNSGQKIEQYCDEANQNSFLEFGHKQNSQMDSFPQINDTNDYIQTWDENSASCEAAAVYSLYLHRKQYQADNSQVKHIKIKSENNQNLTYNKEEKYCDSSSLFSSPGGPQLIQFGPLVSGFTRIPNFDHMSRNFQSSIISNQQKCDTLGCNEYSLPQLSENTHIQWSPDCSHVNSDAHHVYEQAVLSPNPVQPISLIPQSSQTWHNGSQLSSQDFPFKSDVFSEAKAGCVDDVETVISSKSGEDYTQKEKDSEEALSEFKHLAAHNPEGDKICQTNKEVGSKESVNFVKEGLDGCMENQNTQSKLQTTEYEVNKNQQDSEAKTTSLSCSLGDGQADRQDNSPDPRLVPLLPNFRKHRQKSPGTVKKAYKINTTTTEQEAAGAEITENLKSCLEMMDIQEDGQEKDIHKNDLLNTPEREKVMVN